MKKCKVCKKLVGTFADGKTPLFHCPKCNQHQFRSIYGDQCTVCSNTERIPEFEERARRVEYYQNRKWWEFWK